MNKIINSLPFELHLPGYQYCGPGTKLQKRLARGDLGINPLDAACKDHDIAYFNNQDNLQARHFADNILANRAWERVKAKDSTFGEKTAAYAVTNIMKAKSKFGMGMRRKNGKSVCKKMKRLVAFRKIVNQAKHSLNKKSKDGMGIIKSALDAARNAIKNNGGKSNIRIPRILPIPLPKVGGVLPLIPIFAGLSALGTLAGGAAGIAKAVNQSKSARFELDEAKRHNKMMESIAMGKGLYLRPYKVGSGIKLRLHNDTFNKKKTQRKGKKKLQKIFNFT